MTVNLLLQIIAIILLVLQALNVNNQYISLAWLGLALWLLSIALL
jgi:hypothetical protein